MTQLHQRALKHPYDIPKLSNGPPPSVIAMAMIQLEQQSVQCCMSTRYCQFEFSLPLDADTWCTLPSVRALEEAFRLTCRRVVELPELFFF